MYALNESLAIDGKAMYFGEGEAGAGRRTSALERQRKMQPRISRIHTDKARQEIKDLIRENPRNPWLIFLKSDV